MSLDKGEQYNLETARHKEDLGPVIEKGIVVKKDSDWINESPKAKLHIASILLSAINFSIEVTSINSSQTKSKTKKNSKPTAENITASENITNSPPLLGRPHDYSIPQKSNVVEFELNNEISPEIKHGND